VGAGSEFGFGLGEKFVGLSRLLNTPDVGWSTLFGFPYSCSSRNTFIAP
jgi:hypothetical protein